MEYRDILLTSEDTIKSYSNINDNIAGDYLLPSIHIAQRSGLEGILGTLLVNKLQTLIGENELNYEENKHYKELLDDYVTDYLTYAAIVELIPIVSFKIDNMGASTTNEEKATNMSFNEVFKLKDYYADKMDYFAMRMQRYLVDNYSKFPELSNNKISNIKANLDSAAGCSIWVGGKRGKQ